MSIFELVVLIIAGFVAGIIGGTLGVGGGIVIIPTLVFILGMSQHEAQGTSLAFMLPPIGILAAYNYYKSGYVNVKYALVLIAAFVLGGYIGSLISIELPAKLLKKIFGVFILILGIKMILSK